MNMEIMLAVIIVSFMIGAMMGSFACCQAWRLRLREEGSEKKERARWSGCLSCGYKLKWYDNIPVISWIALRGKCRKCKKKIGCWEILSEVGLGVVFAVFGWFFYETNKVFILNNDMTVQMWTMIGLMMALLVGFAILFIYDARWGRLPLRVLVFCIVCAVLFVIVREWGVFEVARTWEARAVEYLGALAVLPMLYYGLYKVSKEKWVGGGDWLVALPIALVLGNFWLAFFCLFVANFLGCLVMMPVMRMRKKNTSMRIPFGPFLIAAFMIVFLCQDWILSVF
jgi:leader peptidase (prepilin peptidase)/N-methyltransferase